MKLGNHGKIAIGWYVNHDVLLKIINFITINSDFRAVITVVGIYSFVLSKRSVDQQRIESMRIRDRMRKSNYGEYEASTRKF